MVSQFRVPEFEVDLSTPVSDYLAGEIMEMNASATYFFGSPVANVELSWQAHAHPSYIHVPGYWGYSFWDRRYYWRAPESWEVNRGSGSVRTDSDGAVRFEQPANLRPGEGTARFTVSAIVTDVNGQSIADSHSVRVHPARYYAGIATSSYLAEVDNPVRIHLVTVDYLRTITPNRPVTVRMIRERWNRQTREYVETETDLQKAMTNADGEATIEFTPTTSGRYRLIAESVDEQGRTARSSRFIWVIGGDVAAWPTSDDGSVALIADRDSYEVGDVAEVLIAAPYEGATALITLERGSIYSTEVRRLESNSTVVKVPIQDRHIPNIYLGVVLYRPPTEMDPYPRYHAGRVNLSVSTEPRRLKVSIVPDRERARPGETVGYDVLVIDDEGRGVASELSVAVVDQAVLSLLRATEEDAMSAFWSERALNVSTRASLTVSIDRRNDLYHGSQDGDLADGDADPLMEPYGREEEEAMNDEEFVAHVGGGGAVVTVPDPVEASDGASEPRSDFRNTALWLGHLRTNEQGKARFELELPDNVTTWQATGRAATTTSQFGQGGSALLVTKPLLVRPALPRVLRVGDEFSVRALVTNRSTKAQRVSVSVLVSGGVRLVDDSDQAARLAAGATEIFSWSGAAIHAGPSNVGFSVLAAAGLSDAVEITIPTQLNITAETVATGGVVEDAAVVETLYLPDYLIPRTGSLELKLQASLVGLLNEELSRFKPYYRESYVRIASRIVASIAVKRSAPNGLSGEQERQLHSDIARLHHGLRYEGWSWCRTCTRVDYWATAWALFALGEARSEGLMVSTTVLDRARSFIYEYVHRETEAESPPDQNEQALLLYSLVRSFNFGDAPGPDEGRAMERYGAELRGIAEKHRDSLTAWGRSYLLLGLLETGHAADHVAVRSLLNGLAASAVSSANGTHWQDPPVRGSMHNGSVRATALVLLSLTRAAPQHPLIEETVRWLVVGRALDRWKSSVERAQGMASLGAYAQLTGETHGAFDYQALLNTQRLLEGRFDVGAGAMRDEVLTPVDELPLGEVSRVQIQREADTEGRMYYALNLRYVTPASEIGSLNRGFAISRRYSLVDEPDRFVSSANLGDLVRVEITVVAPTDRLFVTVEDFLPAGLEPIDARLDTVSHWTKERLRNDRREARRAGGPSYSAPWLPWYYNPWDQIDTRDDRVIVSADRLTEGVYRFTYYARATTPGTFVAPPARVEETYFPEVFGRGDSGRFVVESRE